MQKHPTFLLEAGESINDQLNYNDPNTKLNSLYKVSKAAWMLNYGTMKFLPFHMNFVLVESWGAFKVSAGNIISNIFVKNLLLLISPKITRNTQAFDASIQVPSVSKAEETNKISLRTVAHI